MPEITLGRQDGAKQTAVFGSGARALGIVGNCIWALPYATQLGCSWRQGVKAEKLQRMVMPLGQRSEMFSKFPFAHLQAKFFLLSIEHPWMALVKVSSSEDLTLHRAQEHMKYKHAEPYPKR